MSEYFPENQSKTFVFPDLYKWADFLLELDAKIGCVRASVENTIRVTIGSDITHVIDELAKKHSGEAEEGERGQWLSVSR